MPILSYKPSLISKVINGSKPHTIRFAKRPWKVGDLAIHATGTRTPEYKEHLRNFVTRVDSLEIYPEDFCIYISDGPLFTPMSLANAHLLAKNDGFESLQTFCKFFTDTYKKAAPLRCQLIQWGTPIDYLSHNVKQPSKSTP